MAFSIKDILFTLLPVEFYKARDTNIDGNGKGTFERFNEIIGEDVDDYILPVQNITADTIDPYTALDKFIPYLEYMMGEPVRLGIGLTVRRKMLNLFTNYVKIKGTKRCHDILFKMLGFDTMVLTEFYGTSSFDSGTFDHASRVWDRRCRNCTEYKIDLTGSISVTPAVLDSVFAIVEFNRPINAILQCVTFNGGPLVEIIISVGINDEGELVYNNEYDAGLILWVDGEGDLHVEGPQKAHYSINDEGELLYTV